MITKGPTILTPLKGTDSEYFLKNGQPRLFLFIFGLFNQTIHFVQQNNVKKCPNVHPAYGAGIRTPGLSNMSHHP